MAYRFNPPPNWPKPPTGWTPPPGWQPDPSWPPPPGGWQLWIEILDQPAMTGHGPAPQVWGQPPQPAPPTNLGSSANGSGLFGRRKQAEADAEKARTESVHLQQQLAELERRHAELRARAEASEAELNRVRGLDAAQLSAEIDAARADLAHIRAEGDQARATAELEAARQREEISAQAAKATADIDRQVSEANLRRISATQDAASAEARLADLKRGIAATDDVAMLQELGIYAYRHPLADAVSYKSRLADLTDSIKTAARKGDAVKGATNWTVNGSVQQGRRMVADFSKLMLRAYNAEADYAVRSMRPHRLPSLIDRLDKSRETIARLGKTMDIRITDSYHRLRVRELELTADFLAKQDEEKERRREMREAQREEEKLQREIERERARLPRSGITISVRSRGCVPHSRSSTRTPWPRLRESSPRSTVSSRPSTPERPTSGPVTSTSSPTSARSASGWSRSVSLDVSNRWTASTNSETRRCHSASTSTL